MRLRIPRAPKKKEDEGENWRAPAMTRPDFYSHGKESQSHSF